MRHPWEQRRKKKNKHVAENEHARHSEDSGNKSLVHTNEKDIQCLERKRGAGFVIK